MGRFIKTFLGIILFCGFSASGFALQVGDKAPQFQAVSTVGSFNLNQTLQGGGDQHEPQPTD